MGAERLYDVVILGGGPAGLTAAIYAGRARLETVVIDRGIPGGLMATSDLIENYPAFPQGIPGGELAQLMAEQAERFGALLEMAEVEGLEREGDIWRVRTSEGPYLARAVIVATGSHPRELGVPGERELRGRGISYCATCDGAFFRDKQVLVVGGGDAAVAEAEFLTRFASRVTVAHRRGEFRAARSLQERLLANPKVEVKWHTVVTAFLGRERLEAVRLRDVVTGAEFELAAEGAFIYVGLVPNTEFLAGVVPRDEQGYLVTDESMALPVPGLYAAGDVRRKRLRQIATAVGDAAVAAMAAEEYIVEKFR